jgi:hypothetical protein
VTREAVLQRRSHSCVVEEQGEVADLFQFRHIWVTTRYRLGFDDGPHTLQYPSSCLGVGGADIELQVCMLGDDVLSVAGVDRGNCHYSEVEGVDFPCDDGLKTQDRAGCLDYGVVASVRGRGVGLPAFDLQAALVSCASLEFITKK